MKRLSSVRGVTLLEIMLVLAIAALIIVMSVRYFQAANTSQQATAFVTQAQAIAAAENTVSAGTGVYGNSSSITPLLSSAGLALPWGGTASVGSGTGSFTVSTGTMPAGVCSLVQSQLLSVQNGGNWSVDSDCGTVTYYQGGSTS